VALGHASLFFLPNGETLLTCGKKNSPAGAVPFAQRAAMSYVSSKQLLASHSHLSPSEADISRRCAMDELFSPAVILSGCSVATVLFGSAIVYLEGWLGSEG
jgi:hypothetical protein